MKKVFSIGLLFVFVLALSSCGGKSKCNDCPKFGDVKKEYSQPIALEAQD